MVLKLKELGLKLMIEEIHFYLAQMCKLHIYSYASQPIGDGDNPAISQSESL